MGQNLIDDAVMLDASLPLKFVDNGGISSNFHACQVLLSSPQRRGMHTPIPFAEAPFGPTSFARASNLIGCDTDAQILAPCEGTQYATPDDWEKYRTEIMKLYWDDKKPLREVKALMKTQYGFNATYVCLIANLMAEADDLIQY
jgi:hypothetical protein